LPACEEEGAKKREEREARKGRGSKEERREPQIAAALHVCVRACMRVSE
jgi:hypothetical protein